MRAATLRCLTVVAAVCAVSSCSPLSPTPNASESASPRGSSSPTAHSPSPDASPATPHPTPTLCTSDWGTGPKSHSTTTTASVIGVRTGRHDCYDRLVVDISGPAAGFDARLVDAVQAEGSGEVVDLRGGAFLRVVVLAPAYDPNTGDQTYKFADRRELTDVTGFVSFRQVAWAGSFEGRTVLGVGLTSKLPFRVFILDGPDGGSRVVVDVAH
jgi:hypothetical protein